jgi:opacity protein-like surface antigen
MPMRLSLFVGLLLALTASPPVCAQSNEQAVDAAKQAAQDWLAVFDAGRYDSTWTMASAFFKSKISQEQWVARIKQGRRQRPVLDSLRSRSLAAARYTTSLPKAPDGAYVVVQYRATYADEQWVETVTLTKDPDGWRVAGYFTRPKQ